MLANWGSTGVEERRLTEKNEGPVGGESSLRLGNLFKRAPNVNGRGPQTFRSCPGNRSIQSIVNLEGAGPEAETLQRPAVMRGQLGACNVRKLPGRDVGENQCSSWGWGN